MKKLLKIFMLFNIMFVHGQTVNIPDQKFKNTLLSATKTNLIAKDLSDNWVAIDINNDNEIQLSEAQNISSLYITYRDIESLVGISSFTALIRLDCRGNKLSTFDLSNNISLTHLNCSDNDLIDLNLNNNISLTNLVCADNKLSNLDVSNNTSLLSLSCSRNKLSNLDLSKNILLKSLGLERNEISNIDFRNNVSLEYLDCSSNNLSNLDVSNNTSLTYLQCGYNYTISHLDVSNNVSLIELYCASNNFSTLDLSNNMSLIRIECGFNENLTSINFKNGNNHNFDNSDPTATPFILLPNLSTVCVDDINNVEFLSNFGPSVNFTENCRTLHSNEYFLTNLSLYPIPTSKNLHIRTNSIIVQLEIFNNIGQLISSYSDSNGLIKIDTSELHKGLYFCKVTDDKGISGTKKIIKK
ncbi:T9SS type A sorting domain-containing protein [Aureibaculum conchae]|uniref:T9SS type A sorting domain-containing protein n=1 Tax=Aureibaculum sp. 2308TA14-22 TaxID=3108392 RepID=UPI003395474B